MAISFDPESKSYSGSDFVATVDGVSYKSLSDAISAAGDNATITLVDNVTLTSKLNVSKNLTFDLAGFTLSGAVVISESADVTLKTVI